MFEILMKVDQGFYDIQHSFYKDTGTIGNN